MLYVLICITVYKHMVGDFWLYYVYDMYDM